MNIVFLGVIGTFMFLLGLVARLGYAKFLYLSRGIKGVMPESVQYIYIPLGLTLIGLEIIASDLVALEDRLDIAGYVWLPGLIICFVLAVWQPNWLLPHWLRYLRKTYGHTATKLLLEEARKEGTTWLRQVRTHEGLVEWAEQTARKLGYGTYHYRLDNNLPEDE